MTRRDPGLRQPSDRQQLANVPRIGTVALGALLIAAAGRGLGRLGQVHDRTDLRQLVGDKPPAGRRLQRDLKLLPAELLAELPDALPVRRRVAVPTCCRRVAISPLSLIHI